jgi:6-phosphogluconate dehydrogenase
MQLGMIGLGKMGANMTMRLCRGEHEVVAYDVSDDAVKHMEDQTPLARGASSIEDLVAKLAAPRIVWVMVPSGNITQETIESLAGALESDDVVIDGGNSHYTDSLRHSEMLRDKGMQFVDAGTSGGLWGIEEGYCLMVGAEEDVFRRVEPILSTLAPPNGYARVGPPGSGHFVKMVHNGVEYALMQAYGEGFELLHSGQFDLDLAQIAEVWRHGSVVRSWLLDLAASALKKDPDLKELEDWVDDSGEGRWTVQTAIDNAVPTPTIALSLFSRFASRQDESFSNKLLAALRFEFGGHPFHSASPKGTSDSGKTA